MKKIILFLLFFVSLLPASLFAQTYAKGDKVEVLWHGAWYKSRIERVEKEGYYRVHFMGYWASREEIVPSERIRNIIPRTQPDLNSLKMGSPVEFLEGDHWRPATFVELDGKKAVIRYTDGEAQKEQKILTNLLSIVPSSSPTSRPNP